MKDREYAALDRLDIRKINPDGKYFDLDIPLIFDLNYEQIEYLREKYQDNTIARNVIKPRREIPRAQEVGRRSTPRYSVTRDQKYNRGRHRTKSKVSFVPIKTIIVGSLVIALSATVLISGMNKDKSDSGKAISQSSVVYSQDYDSASSYEYSMDDVYSQDVQGYDYSVVESSDVPQEEVSINGDLIRELCDIYHVNYDVVYPFIKELTNDFTSEQYVSGCIDGVTCKGVPVVANSDRELLVYMVRSIKQLPSKLGISTEGLYENSGYQSGSNYLEQISKVSNDLGVDRCLMYAIVQSETCFNSELFMDSNNPAGIRNEGEWWRFDTKEEGFYELGMELLKYYRMIGVSPSEVNSHVIEQIRDIHAPLSDGNEHWLPNVLENYEYAVVNENALFGSQSENLKMN